jgi:hypothetical protein
VKHKAYAVALIKGGAPSVIVGAGIFGEPTPTTNGLHCLTLFAEEADTLEQACKQCEMLLGDPYYDWLGEARTDPHRGVYRDARKL